VDHALRDIVCKKTQEGRNKGGVSCRNRIDSCTIPELTNGYVVNDDDVYPRETPPHIRTARASPQRHTAAGTAAPTTADTGNTVPQRANPTQTAYAHPRRRAQAQGQRLGVKSECPLSVSRHSSITFPHIVLKVLCAPK